MPLRSYGVLVGRLVGAGGAAADDGHLHLRVEAAGKAYRVSLPWDRGESPVEALVLDRFRHPLTEELAKLPFGYHKLDRKPAGLALDYIRYNLADPRAFLPLAGDTPAAMDLQATIFNLVHWMGLEPFTRIFAFGARLEAKGKADPVFGFSPSRVVHDVHMNQGSPSPFTKENAWWQDGALLVQQPDRGRWTAVLLRFAGQDWHTRPETAHQFPPAEGGGIPFEPAGIPTRAHPDGLVRIVALRVPAPASGAPAQVVLLNTSNRPLPLANWSLTDTRKAKCPLEGDLPAGGTLVAEVRAPCRVGPEGGIVSVLDDRGWKVHGVAYTRDQVRPAGWTFTI